MSRYIYQGTTRDGNGRVILSATVSVYLATTTTAASIYAASSGGSAVNSVTSSSTNGKYLFYVDDGDYASSQLFKISFSRSGYETGTWDNISIVGNSPASVVTLADTQTLTNKTLTAPTITGPTITGTIGGTPTITTPVIASFYQDAAKTKLMTAPNTASDTLAAIAATQTLTNKTLTTPVMASFYQDAGKTKLITAPSVSGDTLVGLVTVQTLTNKTLTGPVITGPNISGVTTYEDGANSIFKIVYDRDMLDDGTITIALGSSYVGHGFLQIGDNQEYAFFCFTSAAAVTLIANSTNAVAADTDVKFCIYDGGTGVIIKNRLGSTLRLRGYLLFG